MVVIVNTGYMYIRQTNVFILKAPVSCSLYSTEVHRSKPLEAPVIMNTRVLTNASASKQTEKIVTHPTLFH